MADTPETTTTLYPATITPIERAEGDGENRFAAVVAANTSLDNGAPDVDVADLELERYLKNPVVLWNHDRWELPVGRSTKVEKLRGELGADMRLEVEFEFLPGDKRADEVRNAWRRGFVRGASIGVSVDRQGNKWLREWSIVSVPADWDAVTASERGLDARIRSVIERAMAEKQEGQPATDNQPVSDAKAPEQQSLPGVSEPVTRSEESVIDPKMAALDERMARVEALIERLIPKEEPAEEVDNEQPDRDTIRAEERLRAATIQRAMPLIAEDKRTGVADMELKDLMVMAIGDEAPKDIAERSEDYVRAIFDGIVERREKAGNTLRQSGVIGRSIGGVSKGTPRRMSISELQAMKQRRAS